MNDPEILARIHTLVEEEHQLESGAGLDDAQKERLHHVEVALDQCWDLLRQRRARRDAGLAVDSADVRSEDVVENYQQ